MMTHPTAGLGQTRPRPRLASDRAARIWPRSMSVGVTAANFADEGFEILRLTEVAIDGSKTDIRDLVEGAEGVHYRLTNDRGGDFSFTGAFEPAYYSVDDTLQTLGINRPLAQADLHRAQ